MWTIWRKREEIEWDLRGYRWFWFLVLSLWFFVFLSFVRLVFQETLGGEIWGFLYPSFCSLGVYIDATDLEVWEMTHLPFRFFCVCVCKKILSLFASFVADRNHDILGPDRVGKAQSYPMVLSTSLIDGWN